MYTIRTILFDRENSKGLKPVKIVVTVKGKRAYFTTGVRVKPEYWNEQASEVISSHPTARNYNKTILNKRVEIENKLQEKIQANRLTSIDSVKNNKQFKLVPYMEKFIDRQTLNSKFKPGTTKRYKVELTKLQNYDPEITFASIDPDWLLKYETHLRKTQGNNTTHGSFKALRRVFNDAIRHEVTNNYPFKLYENPRYNQTNPTYLTKKELEIWEKTLSKPLDETVRLCGKYFLLGCYSGLRVSDWLRFNKEFIEGDRMILRADKNGKLVSMKMHSRLKALVKELLKAKKLPTEQKINEYLKIIAKHAKINKRISTHSGRHTFAMHCAWLGIPIESTAESMGISTNVCRVYYRIAGYKIDNDMKKWDK